MAVNVLFPALFGLALLWATSVQGAYTGSTKGLKKEFNGRCLEYLQKYLSLNFVEKPPVKGQEVPYCDNIWKIFLKAFASKDACTVTAQDYMPFFEATGNSKIINKVLFWSKHQDLSLRLSNKGKRAAVLADTLAGYLVTDLNWCGEVKGAYNPANPDGINFHECPKCKKNDKDPTKEHFEIFWGIASEMFAKRAEGVVRHLVNGAIKVGAAYNQETFFYKHELKNIAKIPLKQFRIIVANKPGETVHETCGKNSIKTLADDVKTLLGQTPVCVVNPKEVMHIFCEDTPKAAACQSFSGYPDF